MPKARPPRSRGSPFSQRMPSLIVNVHSVKSCSASEFGGEVGTSTISPVSGRTCRSSGAEDQVCRNGVVGHRPAAVGSRVAGPVSGDGSSTLIVPPSSAPSIGVRGALGLRSLSSRRRRPPGTRRRSSARCCCRHLRRRRPPASRSLPHRDRSHELAALHLSLPSLWWSTAAQVAGGRSRGRGGRLEVGDDASRRVLGVEGVADRVAEQVQGDHQQDDPDHGLPQVLRVGLEPLHGPGDGLAPRAGR